MQDDTRDTTMQPEATPFVRPGHTLMLRTCRADSTAYNNFLWPEAGHDVECPDWSTIPECGNGLHGFLRGVGDGSLANWDPDARWLVVEIEVAVIVQLDGKIKVSHGRVLFNAPDRTGALALMAVLGHLDDDHLGGTATAGDRGTATAGEYGTATAGARGTATAGYGGTATAGYGGTATAGDHGTLIIKWWDEAAGRYRRSTGYCGEDGIEVGGRYQLDGAGKFVRVQTGGAS